MTYAMLLVRLENNTRDAETPYDLDRSSQSFCESSFGKRLTLSSFGE